jgi:3-hydroxyanthranilate 3,4-dioxygenase
MSSPLNLRAWIDEHRNLLKPPVGNKCVWEDRDFIVMVVGGPNTRKDYHINPTEELFYQLEGDVTVRVIDHHGRPRDIPIREGDLFLLPPGVPHSPQRPAGTVGLVVERRRPQGEDDGLRFYCDRCGAVVYEERFELKDIAAQLKQLMDNFWSDATLRTCVQCGQVVQPPSGAAAAPPKDLAFPRDLEDAGAPAPKGKAKTAKAASAPAPAAPAKVVKRPVLVGAGASGPAAMARKKMATKLAR